MARHGPVELSDSKVDAQSQGLSLSLWSLAQSATPRSIL